MPSLSDQRRRAGALPLFEELDLPPLRAAQSTQLRMIGEQVELLE
jgi:hypothetical protein